MTMKPIIAIDGPAAAGKGTLARRLAAALGLPYLDTGLLYRAVGRLVLDAGGDPGDAATAESAARSLRPADLERCDLRGPQADAAAPSVASIPGVRAALLAFQRDFAKRDGAVLDGRDIGTVIFPTPPRSCSLPPALAERARRRWLELQLEGTDADFATVEEDMRQRDAMDAARATAPLRPADDAYQLDTTTMDAEAAFRRRAGFHTNASDRCWLSGRPQGNGCGKTNGCNALDSPACDFEPGAAREGDDGRTLQRRVRHFHLRPTHSTMLSCGCG